MGGFVFFAVASFGRESCDVVAAPVEEGGDVDDMAMAVG